MVISFWTLDTEGGYKSHNSITTIDRRGRPRAEAMGYRQRHIGTLGASLCRNRPSRAPTLWFSTRQDAVYHQEVPPRVYIAGGLMILLDLASQNPNRQQVSATSKFLLVTTIPCLSQSLGTRLSGSEDLAGRDIKRIERDMEMICVWVHGSAISCSLCPLIPPSCSPLQPPWSNNAIGRV